MAGRAGRRGRDDTGTCLIYFNKNLLFRDRIQPSDFRAMLDAQG